MSITDRTYTITLYFSEMGSTFTVIQTTENSDEAARFIAKTKQAMLGAAPLMATYTANVYSIIRSRSIVMVRCDPALTLAEVEAAEQALEREDA